MTRLSGGLIIRGVRSFVHPADFLPVETGCRNIAYEAVRNYLEVLIPSHWEDYYVNIFSVFLLGGVRLE